MKKIQLRNLQIKRKKLSRSVSDNLGKWKLSVGRSNSSTYAKKINSNPSETEKNKKTMYHTLKPVRTDSSKKKKKYKSLGKKKKNKELKKKTSQNSIESFHPIKKKE